MASFWILWLALSLTAPVSKIQHDAVADCLTRNAGDLTGSQKATLTQQLMTVPCASDDVEQVLELMLGDDDNAGGARRKQQNFKAIVYYGSKLHWDRLDDPTATSFEKEDLILDLAKAFGLRCPTEHTLRFFLLSCS